MAEPTVPVNIFPDRIILDPHQNLGESRNLRDIAENGGALVGQIREVLDSGYLSSLVIDVELLEAKWIHQFTIEIPSDSTHSKEEKTEVGMSVTEGKEVVESVSASAGFSGWGFSAEVSGSTETRTFSSIETSELKTVTDTYNVPAKSDLWVYKPGYKFRCTLHDAFAKDHKGKIQAHFVNTIVASHELMGPVELKGTGTLSSELDGLLLPTKGVQLTIAEYVVYGAMYPWLQNGKEDIHVSSGARSPRRI
ncbi:uncharacterized protein N7446_007871 [Penicillium canescens]|uniref:Uncharacterized protein n=1 Tax=Penicillium canescens TaxID=5083 RepID=A0AAD6IN37_PENCN|nr:uncharacterized protein N7446_007871 [Penicillium canescens]KAJ6033838.1 hypothetical protein N7444_011609 [Penicillium canescens]KAJ6056972.1 hypothetical protein N7460_000246 [Penicillium canescens]KAJ6058288.1 hypothetical protein N7446_007871 [Penicillium canescens]